MSNEPVALFYFPGKKMKFFKIRPKGKYFVMYNKFLKGIFEMKDDMVYFLGKTAVYQYVINNSTNFDPVIVNELNRYRRRNNLTKIKRKDVKHSSFLLSLKEKISKEKSKEKSDPTQELMDIQSGLGREMENSITDGIEQMESQLETENEERDDNNKLKLDEPQQAVFLLNYLLEKKKVDENEHATFVYKVSNDMLNFEGLITELKDKSVVQINEPMDLDMQGFLEDFGAQNPLELSGMIDDYRESRKGLKTLTATPIKSFIPGSVIIAIGLVGIIGVYILGGNPEIFTNLIGEIKLPGLP